MIAVFKEKADFRHIVEKAGKEVERKAHSMQADGLSVDLVLFVRRYDLLADPDDANREENE